jgi:single-strand DNA-binding protein
MYMDSLIAMTGRVGGEVEYRPVNSNVAFANFRLACTPRVQRNGTWEDAETTWVSVSCTRGLAEHVKCSLVKGDPVLVYGRLRTRRWVDTNGVEHEQLTIEARSVGHDLNLGTSRFTRVRRGSAPGQAPGNGAADGEEFRGDEAEGREPDDGASDDREPDSEPERAGRVPAGAAA